jgi:hypothetical protein
MGLFQNPIIRTGYDFETSSSEKLRKGFKITKLEPFLIREKPRQLKSKFLQKSSRKAN